MTRSMELMQGSKDDEWQSRSHPIKEDMSFQRRDWVFERVSWCFLYLILALAAAGFFSVGPFSDNTATDASATLQVDYQRFHRNGALADMVLHVSGVDSSVVRLHFNDDFMEAFIIEDMRPQPVASAGESDGVEFVFDSSRSRQFSIYIALRPGKPGFVSAAVRLADQEPVPYSLLVYP